MEGVLSYLLTAGFVLIVVLMVFSTCVLMYFVMRDIFRKGE